MGNRASLDEPRIAALASLAGTDADFRVGRRALIANLLVTQDSSSIAHFPFPRPAKSWRIRSPESRGE